MHKEEGKKGGMGGIYWLPQQKYPIEFALWIIYKL